MYLNSHFCTQTVKYSGVFLQIALSFCGMLQKLFTVLGALQYYSYLPLLFFPVTKSHNCQLFAKCAFSLENSVLGGNKC